MASSNADLGALSALALSAKAMVEDGHPDSPEWFRIMSERVNAISDDYWRYLDAFREDVSPNDGSEAL